MKKCFLIPGILFLCFNSFSQIKYDKGYYIDTANQKVDCFIKNLEWKNNPTDFEYKLSEDSKPEKQNIQSVKEFGILGGSKFVNQTVNIDRSPELLGDLSEDRNPVFQKEQLFLKVLVDGDADLFSFEASNLWRFFYTTNDGSVEQLVYKSYKTYSKELGNQIAKNNQFRQQLYMRLKCQDISEKDVKDIRYVKQDLVKLFVKYNKCENADFVNQQEESKKDLFNLTIRPGLNIGKLAIANSYSDKAFTFDNELSARFGLEAEFILPFNKNKWAVIVEPSYQTYKTSLTYTHSIFGVTNLEVDYKSIEFPIGVRYCFFLNDVSKIFVNGAIILSYPLGLDSSIKLDSEHVLEAEGAGNFAFGVGYKYAKRYSVEFRYATSREILVNYGFWNSDYRSVSINFGYTLF